MKDINEILNAEVISIDEAAFVVEQYILAEKGETVIINLIKGMPPMDKWTGIHSMHYWRQVDGLMNAFKYAWKYFNEKNEDKD